MKKTKLFMDTIVEIKVVSHENFSKAEVELKMDRAFDAFRKVEQACSRFSPDSELSQASRYINQSVQIRPFLFEPFKFALEIAKFTEGEFDPAIGKRMEEHGFNRHYLTGDIMESDTDESVSYKDIVLDEQNRTFLLKKAMVVDLGAVAKGFAIDLAANELRSFDGFIVNAGGDLYAGGLDENGLPWKIGIQHPAHQDETIEIVGISNEAICTSGSYARRSAKVPGMHHIIHPKTGQSPNDWVSCSVIAPYAMMADAFSTTAFLLGREKGKKLIESLAVKGLFISSEMEIERVGVI